MSPVPCLFYPTLTVFIDDDSDMLALLVKSLHLDNHFYKTFTAPQQGIDYINSNHYRQELSERLICHDDEENLYYQDDVIARELFNAERYDQISTLVIDYDMPGQNGLQVCAAISNPYIKKIMLTGAADEKLAIDAFNKGLIHQYIRKQDPDFTSQLQKSIQLAQRVYFEELSALPLKILAARYDSTALVDPAFKFYFDQLIKEHSIVEYYLAENTGSFIMVDDHNKIYSLITLNDDMVEMYLSSQASETLTPDQIQAVESKQVIPCYYDPFHKPNIATDHLSHYLHKPTVLQGSDKLYYCVFGQGFIPVNLKNIVLK